MKKKISLLLLILSLSTSCSINDINKSNIVEVASSAAGGYLGYEFSDGDLFSTTIGSATGLVFGKVFSEFLGQDDYYYFEKEALRVLEMNNNNVTGYWKNPKTGHEGIIKISGYYGDPECRLLEHIYVKDGGSSSVLDTACREDSGLWAMIK